ncbi:MAG: permease [Verrucomicrobia bacterium TMED44]|nr:MAG: permease [Verrucomicrobia bacterium TMED44]
MNESTEKKKRSLKKRLKQQYMKYLDKVIRTNALQKLFRGILYLIGFIISVILGTLLYLNS